MHHFYKTFKKSCFLKGGGIITSLLLFFSFTLSNNVPIPYNIQDDINTKFTNVGNIQMTVTNYGTIGKGYCGNQPSCMYPANSGIENLWLGGLWVGGYKNGQIHVTTGAIDVSNPNKTEGFEFTNGPGSVILERSSLITSAFYDPKAISHQDFICDFFDTITTGIQNHNPMGIKVLLQTYTYNLNFANYFVILNYKIVNIGYNGDTSPVDSLCVGLWKDCVVRNINVDVNHGCNPGYSFFSKGATGYIDSLRMEYTYDNNGDPGLTDNYVGIKLLGVTPKIDTERVHSKFTIWQFKNTSDPIYFSPQDDASRYSKLKGFLAPGTVIDIDKINYLRLNPANRISLISYGPYKKQDGTPFSLRYSQDTLNIVFAVVCAKKNGTDPARFDTDFQKQILYKNAGWAQRAYDNGYKLPAPPDIPITRAELGEKRVTLWWSNNAENSVDPISGNKDFEGYRIYRTNAGADLTQNFDLQSALKIVGDFDSCCNAYSNNTGFGFIKQSTPQTFPGDPNQYWYKFEFSNQLNGFQYIYSVSAYDKGDPVQGVESLESSLLANTKRVIVGTPPKDNSSADIGVYPNPYYGSAYWDGTGTQKEVLRKIYFFNLPSKCDITIWTLSGDLVQTLYHDASTYSGNDIRWFKTYSDGSQKFSGGEHAWDLISKDNQAVATGLYFFTVKDNSTGDIKKGKFLIVK
jgi:hypothetical protein